MATSDDIDDVDLEALEQERSFLLRSLADLDAEHEVGDIEDDDYQSLTDDYTARAAAVLRAIQAERGLKSTPLRSGGAPRASRVSTGEGVGRRRPATASAGPSSAVQSGVGASSARARRPRRTILIVVAVVGFGAAAVWAVTQSSGKRQAGETVTGNQQLDPTSTTLSGGVDPRLTEAQKDVNNGDVADALKLYDAVLKDDPSQPVALAYGGWLEANAGMAGNRTDLVDAGLAQIVKAEQVDTSFADPHFFRGYLLLHVKNDASGAVTELRTYLAEADPTGPQIPAVQQDLADAIKAAGPNVPPGPIAATTTTP
jgi:hypothetical protein